jgi:membrane protease YdiL (CAAX protease family)
MVKIRGPDDIRVRVEPVAEGNPTWPLYTGPNADPAESNEYSDERGWMWLFLWVATQFVLVAFPEEYFYRGFIQTRLEQGFEARAEAKGKAMTVILGFTPAILVSSILFGIGHLLVPVGGAILGNRMSVFFPALLFGWLRRRTGSILASTIYHAFSNMMVLVAAVHFV